MKSSTYNWIIGCLSAVIVVTLSYLLAEENGRVSITISECLSVAATISSLILSIIAMFYTYLSGRDTLSASKKIQDSVELINGGIAKVEEVIKANANKLTIVEESIKTISKNLESTEKLVESFRPGEITEGDKNEVIKSIQDTRESMTMFLNMMQQ